MVSRLPGRGDAPPPAALRPSGRGAHGGPALGCAALCRPYPGWLHLGPGRAGHERRRCHDDETPFMRAHLENTDLPGDVILALVSAMKRPAATPARPGWFGSGPIYSTACATPWASSAASAKPIGAASSTWCRWPKSRAAGFRPPLAVPADTAPWSITIPRQPAWPSSWSSWTKSRCRFTSIR